MSKPATGGSIWTMRSCAARVSPTTGRSCTAPLMNVAQPQKENPHGMSGNLLLEAYVFVLALFVGFQLISKVPSVLHTPLMSGTNAIHGIILVGAIVLASGARGALGTAVAAAAVLLATMNVVDGIVVTDRMLEMFKQRPATRAPQQPEAPAPAQKAR